jgi:pimeloyl-ACP methyl ester carboxylesterase
VRPRRITFTGAEGNRLVADLWEGGERTALLLHGGGQTRHAWDDLARRLADVGWTAVALDQRGHGESDWVGSGRYAFADFAADAALVARDICRRFGREPNVGRKPIAIGASLGGIAALMAEGEAASSLFEALVVIDITPRMDPSGVAKITGFMRRHAREGFASLDEAAEAVAAYLAHRRRPANIEGLRKNLRLSPDGRYHWHWDPRFLDGPGAVLNSDESRTLAAARALKIPTLLLRAGRDSLVGDAHAHEFLQLVPHARAADLGEAHHMVAGERNDAFAAAVLDFLAEFAVRPAGPFSLPSASTCAAPLGRIASRDGTDDGGAP